jgi:hypothetical protein
VTTYKTHLDCGVPLMIILAVLLDRLGGEASITQTDIDKIAYGRVLEGEVIETGALALKLEQRTKQ